MRDHRRDVPGQVGPDDQRDQPPALGEDPLQERQLHLQAVLGGVGCVRGHDGVDARAEVARPPPRRARRRPAECARRSPCSARSRRPGRSAPGRAGPPARPRRDRSRRTRSRRSAPSTRARHAGRRSPRAAPPAAGGRGPALTLRPDAEPAGPRRQRLARLRDVPVHAGGQPLGLPGVERPGHSRLTDAPRSPGRLPPELHGADLLTPPAGRAGPGPTPSGVGPSRHGPDPHQPDPTTSAIRTGSRLRPHVPAGPSNTPAICVPHPGQRPASSSR